tara:strand:- start:4318 stop:4740 length:423 start_codon:yes stop_codon:yes gene_type:complete
VSFSARSFLGSSPSSALSAYLKSGYYFDYNASPGTATVTFTALSAGTISVAYSGSDNYVWLTGSGTNVDYDIKFTVVTGDIPTSGSTTGVWHNLGSNRAWVYSVSGGVKTSSILVEISDAATNTNILASQTITIEVDSTL